MNRKIIYISGLFPKEKEKEILNYSKGNIQNAANNLQWSIFEGLNNIENRDLYILNSMFIGSFPKRYKKIRIKSHIFNNNPRHRNIGFINLPLFKFYHKYLTLKKEIKKIDLFEFDTVISYAMTETNLKLIKSIKKNNSRVKTVLIVPDLPEYMNMQSKKSFVYKIFKRKSYARILQNLKYVDYFCFLTSHMAEKLNISQNYCIVEGITTNSTLQESRVTSLYEKSMDEIVYMYSGGLSEAYGVKELVDNFVEITNNKLRLIVCGFGELNEYIKEKADQDNRIIYYGQLSRSEVLSLQYTADFLVNPRANNHEFTKYSFPSKLIEYMTSGNPVISFKLDGIPNEYYDHLILIDDFNYSIKETIENTAIFSQEKKNSMGRKAKRFIEKYKTPNYQVGKLIKMIGE